MDDNKIVYELTTSEFDLISRDLRYLKRASDKTNNFFDYKVIEVPNSNTIYLVFKLDPDSINRFNAGANGQLKLKLLAEVTRVSSNKKDDEAMKKDEKTRFAFNWLDVGNEDNKQKVNLDLLKQMRSYSENGDPNLSDIKCIVCGRRQKNRRSMNVVEVEGSKDYQFIGSNCVNLYLPINQRKLIEKIMSVLLLVNRKKSISYNELPAVSFDEILNKEIELFLKKLYGSNYYYLVNGKISINSSSDKTTKPKIDNVFNSSMDTIELMFKETYGTDAMKFGSNTRQNILNIIFAQKNKKEDALELVKQELTKAVKNNFNSFYHGYCLKNSKSLNDYYEHGASASKTKVIKFDKLTLANNDEPYSIQARKGEFNYFTNSLSQLKVYKDDFPRKSNKNKKLIKVAMDKNGVDTLQISPSLAEKVDKIKLSGETQEAKEIQDGITKEIENYRNTVLAERKDKLVQRLADNLSRIIVEVFYSLSKANNNKLLFPYDYQKDTIVFALANLETYGNYDAVFKMIKDDFLKSIKSSRSLTQQILNAREFIMAAQQQDGKILALTANNAHKAIKKALTSSKMTSVEFDRNDLSFMKNYETQIKCFLKVDLNKLATFYDTLIDKEIKALKNLIMAELESDMISLYMDEVNKVATASASLNEKYVSEDNGSNGIKKAAIELFKLFNKHTKFKDAREGLTGKLNAISSRINSYDNGGYFDVKAESNVDDDKLLDLKENLAMTANFVYGSKNNFVLFKDKLLLTMFNFKETIELIPVNKEVKFHLSVDNDNKVDSVGGSSFKYFLSTPFFTQEVANRFTKDSIFAFVSYYSYLFVKKYYQEVANIANKNGLKFTTDIQIKHDQSQIQKYATYEILCRKLLNTKIDYSLSYDYNSSLLGNYAILDAPYLSDGVKIESEGLHVANNATFVTGDYNKLKLTAYTPVPLLNDEFVGYYQDFEFVLGKSNQIILPVLIKAGKVTTTLSEEQAQEVYHKVINFITKNVNNRVLDSLKLNGPSEPQIETVSLDEFKKLF